MITNRPRYPAHQCHILRVQVLLFTLIQLHHSSPTQTGQTASLCCSVMLHQINIVWQSQQFPSELVTENVVADPGCRSLCHVLVGRSKSIGSCLSLRASTCMCIGICISLISLNQLLLCIAKTGETAEFGSQMLPTTWTHVSLAQAEANIGECGPFRQH